MRHGKAALIVLLTTAICVTPLTLKAEECQHKKGWRPPLESFLQKYPISDEEARESGGHLRLCDGGEYVCYFALGEADLCNADLRSVDLRGADLRSANLGKADLMGADLREALLSGANLAEADLSGAKLIGADLSDADLSQARLVSADLRTADLSRADLFMAALPIAKLSRAILIEAYLSEADLRRANLIGADLTKADLDDADLTDANLRGANLRQAELHPVVLNAADLRGADFSGALLSIEDPGNLKKVRLLGAKGLSRIRFVDPIEISELRSLAEKAGLRQESRALTSALRKFTLKTEPAHVQLIERWFLGGKLTDFGASPSSSLLALLCLIPAFVLIYIVPISIAPESKTSDSGIYRILVKGRIEHCEGAYVTAEEEVVEPYVASGPRVLYNALYFSVLSAFHIGWRELNVGSWLARLQSREYGLRAKGWVRVVCGAQSLISVYLLAMWALTYFGRPFQ